MSDSLQKHLEERSKDMLARAVLDLHVEGKHDEAKQLSSMSDVIIKIGCQMGNLGVGIGCREAVPPLQSLPGSMLPVASLPRTSVPVASTVIRSKIIIIGDSQANRLPRSLPNVFNMACRGASLTDLLSKIKNFNISMARSIVLIGGSNDFLNSPTRLEGIVKNYENLFVTVHEKAPESKIIISGLLTQVINGRTTRKSEEVAALNELLKKRITEFVYCSYVDPNKYTVDEPNEGIHWSRKAAAAFWDDVKSMGCESETELLAPSEKRQRTEETH